MGACGRAGTARRQSRGLASPTVTRIAAKQRTVFACTECGQQSPKWMGQCPACRTWNTLQEELVAPEPKGATPRGWGAASAARPLPLREVEGAEEARTRT